MVLGKRVSWPSVGRAQRSTWLPGQNQKLYVTSASQVNDNSTDKRQLAAIQDIKSKVPTAKVEFIEIDLGSFSSIKKGADDFLRYTYPMFILVKCRRGSRPNITIARKQSSMSCSTTPASCVSPTQRPLKVLRSNSAQTTWVTSSLQSYSSPLLSRLQKPATQV